MKVFATTVENNVIKLHTWSSVKRFHVSESWLDEKFIHIATSSDFKGDGGFISYPLYDTKKEFVESTCSKSFSLISTQHEVDSHNIMFYARKKHLGIKTL